jgi:prolyl oligopeptidase
MMTALALVYAVVLSAAAQLEVPKTPLREATETYFGQSIVDPYRWMERANPDFVAWLRAQDAYARSLLQSIPGREPLRARLAVLDQPVASVTFPQQGPGDLYFYLKTEPATDIRKLYVRRGVEGAERLLVDADRSAVIDYFAPSLDGKYVAYVSSAGSESVLQVIETDTGRILPDQIDRTRFANVSWLPDGNSFFYWRSTKLTAGALPSDANKGTRSYLHILGQNPEKDRPLFGYKLSTDIDLSEVHYPAVTYPPGSPYVIAAAVRGVKNEMILFATLLSALGQNPIPWKKIADEDDAVTGFAVRANDIYLLTRNKVLRTSLIRPNVAKAKTVLAPSDAIIKEIHAAKDGLYAGLLDGGLGRVKRLSYANHSSEELVLPCEGTVSFLAADARFPGAFINLASWTHSPLWYRSTPESKKLTDTGLQTASPVDFSNYEGLEVKAKSNDGTMVPLSIILKKGTPRDGSHPTLLYGYGAWGLPTLPSFDPKRLAWLERGGVLAYAHVRGGGEYGEEWHRAGQKKTKMNSIDDFIACARYLIEQRWTSPAKLAGMGANAGGVLIGRTVTKRPDLFAAAVSRLGVSNPLRLEFTPAGPQFAMEFGTVRIHEEFEALREMDPYLNVAPDTKYPAVLLTAGINDARIPSWQPAKLAARLQAFSNSGKPVLLRVDAGREELTDIYAFLLWQLGEPEFQPTPPAPTPAH